MPPVSVDLPGDPLSAARSVVAASGAGAASLLSTVVPSRCTEESPPLSPEIAKVSRGPGDARRHTGHPAGKTAPGVAGTTSDVVPAGGAPPPVATTPRARAARTRMSSAGGASG